jgi:hypothetical protein
MWLLRPLQYRVVANLSTKSLFPGGSYDAERILSLIIALAAAIVTVVWGPRTLSAQPYPRQDSSPLV